MKIIKVSDRQCAVVANYFSRALNEHARAVPGMKFDWDQKIWVGSLDACAALSNRLLSVGVMVDDSISRDPHHDLLLGDLPGLREYQKAGVRFLLEKSSEGALLADGMRLGKTAQTCVFLSLVKQKTVVIAPHHVIGVWERELKKWAPELSVYVCEGTKPSSISEDVVLIHYEIVKDWISSLRADILVLDEAHLLIGSTSKRAVAIHSLASKASRRVALTGTPMTGSPNKMFNLLDTICPGRFGYFFRHDQDEKSVGTFSRVFCDAKQKEVGSGVEKKLVWDFGGSKNLNTPDGVRCLTDAETLKRRLAYFMLRRTKQEVDSELPEKTRQIVDVRVPPKACVGFELAVSMGKTEEFRSMLDVAADAKLKPIVSLLRQHCLDEQKVIAFCYRRQFAETLAKKLYDEGCFAVWTHGGISQGERDLRIDQMRNSDLPGVLCCTIDTTATGIDLSFADVSVFCELSWEPDMLIQAEERTYRVGGNKQFIQYVIARGTGDELILRGVVNKLDNFEMAIGVLDGMRQDLGKKEANSLKRLSDALGAM